MVDLFSLGYLYPSDFIKDEPRSNKYELKLVYDKKRDVVRLEKSAPFEFMYGQYWYRSGINQTMRNELQDIVKSIEKIIKLKENDIWFDIGSNDGTLLSFVDKKYIRIGIDPCDDSYTIESKKYADLIIQDYFKKDLYEDSKFGHIKAKVITAIAMFYDLEEPELFLKDIYDIMDDQGLFVLQLSYTPLMLKQLAFDNICFEHIYYYSLYNIKKLFESNGFKLMDCQLNDVNGGSFRVYFIKNICNENVFYTKPYRDVCEFRVRSILEYEKILRLSCKETWLDFYDKINDLKDETYDFIKNEKEKGKVIWGYGGSTKGNTTLQYFNLDNTLIDGIAERSKYKWGLKTVGTNISIYSENEMRKIKPDYLLILPWHFINEFIEREKDYLINGGKFIVPCPKFNIISL